MLMESCSCGCEKKDTSCYNCLRSYGNQKYHDYLERRYVIDFLSHFFDDKLEEPILWTGAEQHTDVKSAFEQMIMRYGLIVSDSKQFTGLAKEYLKPYPKQREAILAVYGAGIVDDIWGIEKITEETVGKVVKRITALTDVDNSLVKWAVELWMSVYGEEYLGKEKL